MCANQSSSPMKTFRVALSQRWYPHVFLHSRLTPHPGIHTHTYTHTYTRASLVLLPLTPVRGSHMLYDYETSR